MELGNKIKHLRLRAGITQETLAEEMGVSFQSVSKWENNVCLPDIIMLPKLSVYFGVTIDELFDLTAQQRLDRTERMLDLEQTLSPETFNETIRFLKEQLEDLEGKTTIKDKEAHKVHEANKARLYSLLAHTYHHRMLSDSEIVSDYAKRAMRLAPNEKDCQWLLQKAENAYIVDWNIRNHSKVIDFYKELISENKDAARTYLYLIDNLLADGRTIEAKEYLQQYAKLSQHNPIQVDVITARIALAEHKLEEAEQLFQKLEEKYPEDDHALFDMANFYAETCQYDKAYEYYERSFSLDERYYTDAYQGMATIRELQGRYEEAIELWERILEVLKEKHHYTEGAPIEWALAEKARLMEKCK